MSRPGGQGCVGETEAAAPIVSYVNTTTIDTAATISIDDLWTASNQIDTELTQIFADAFAQHRTWRKAAAYTDALTACDTRSRPAGTWPRKPATTPRVPSSH